MKRVWNAATNAYFKCCAMLKDPRLQCTGQYRAARRTTKGVHHVDGSRKLSHKKNPEMITLWGIIAVINTYTTSCAPLFTSREHRASLLRDGVWRWKRPAPEVPSYCCCVWLPSNVCFTMRGGRLAWVCMCVYDASGWFGMWVFFALFFTRLAFAHTGLGCVMGYSGFPSFLYALVRVCIMSVCAWEIAKMTI